MYVYSVSIHAGAVLYFIHPRFPSGPSPCIYIPKQRYELLIRLFSLVFILIVSLFFECGSTRRRRKNGNRIESDEKRIEIDDGVCVCARGVPMFGLRLTKRQLCNRLNLIRLSASQPSGFQSFILTNIKQRWKRYRFFSLSSPSRFCAWNSFIDRCVIVSLPSKIHAVYLV